MLKPQSRIRLKKYLNQLKSLFNEVLQLQSQKKELIKKHQYDLYCKQQEISKLKMDLADAHQRIQKIEVSEAHQICHELSLKSPEEFVGKSVLWLKTDSYASLNDVTLKRISDVLKRFAEIDLILLTPNKDIDEKGYTDEEFAAAGLVSLDYGTDNKTFHKHCNKMRKIREEAKKNHFLTANNQTRKGEKLTPDILFGVLKHK